MGHIETVEILVAAGADVNAESEEGNTPLTWAAKSGHPEIVDILKQAGARQ